MAPHKQEAQVKNICFYANMVETKTWTIVCGLGISSRDDNIKHIQPDQEKYMGRPDQEKYMGQEHCAKIGKIPTLLPIYSCVKVGTITH